MISFLYRLLPELTEYMSKMVGVLCHAEINFFSVFFALFVFVLCLVYPMLIVFLDGPILTTTSDSLSLSNYLNKVNHFLN
jgi:hypothetical protein